MYCLVNAFMSQAEQTAKYLVNGAQIVAHKCSNCGPQGSLKWPAKLIYIYKTQSLSVCPL